jgi:hypothetical protein
VKVYVTPADGWVPGLVDVWTEDGERLYDLTLGQLWSLAYERGWDVQPAMRPQLLI